MPLTRAATISTLQQRNWLGFVLIINKNAGFSVVSCPFRMYKARPVGYSYSALSPRRPHGPYSWLVLHPFFLGLDPLFRTPSSSLHLLGLGEFFIHTLLST